MTLRKTWRAAWSLMLAMSVVLWSATVYADHMGGSAQVCHEDMHRAAHHQCGAEAAEPACQVHVNAAPCCPQHTVSAAQQCESAHECCLWDGEAPSAPALVVASHSSPTKQLQHAAVTTNFVAAPPPQVGIVLAQVASSPPYTRPVFEKKTDLRI